MLINTLGKEEQSTPSGSECDEDLFSWFCNLLLLKWNMVNLVGETGGKNCLLEFPFNKPSPECD